MTIIRLVSGAPILLVRLNHVYSRSKHLVNICADKMELPAQHFGDMVLVHHMLKCKRAY